MANLRCATWKRLARVLGDRVQEQLGDAYARAIVITPFPTGATVVVLPHVTSTLRFLSWVPRWRY